MNNWTTITLFVLALLAPAYDLHSAANPSFGCKIFIPNAFSPNDDGTNDIFKLETLCTIGDYDLRIYNRWGVEVFSSSSIDQGWDGEIKGQPAAQGAYYYILRYSYNEGESMERELVTGDLLLLR